MLRSLFTERLFQLIKAMASTGVLVKEDPKAQ
jgi:hypothetical protein